MKFQHTQRVQDCVHGLMEFTGSEALIIEALSSPEIQRLRRVRQLGLAYLVFPGAEHSRLSHSLGASYLALRFARHLATVTRSTLGDVLVPGEEAIRDLGIAGLCHDLGHGPLSHTWEREVIGPDFDRAAWITGLGLTALGTDLEGAKWHELVTQGLLRSDGVLHSILEGHEAGFAERIADLLLGKYYISYLPRLLASDVDVDRADFLKRDAVLSGAEYGYDLSWLISTCQVGENESKQLVVGFDERKGSSVVRQFLVSRRALYDTVYYHKTVRSAEGMVGLFLRRFREVNASADYETDNPFVRSLLRVLSGEVLDVSDILYMDDYGLWMLITQVARDNGADFTLNDLAKRVITRDLFTEVPIGRGRLQRLTDPTGGFERVYEAVAPFVSGDPHYYVHADRISFDWFEDELPRRGYLIDSAGEAKELRHRQEFQSISRFESYLRLFTVKQAVPAVLDAIGR